VKRRKVIKQIGLGLSAGIVLPGWFASCAKDDPMPAGSAVSVGVIGAGAAGLYVADILKAQGINVKIFEASDRIGGRVRTLKSNDKPSASLLFTSQAALSSDFPNELGAGQIFGSDSSWSKIIEQLQLTTVNISTSSTDNYFLDGAFVESSVAEADGDFTAARNFVNAISSYAGGNVSVQQAIESAGISPRMYAILNSWIGNRYGTSNDYLGMQALAQEMELLTRNNEILTLSDNPMQDALLSRFSTVVPGVEVNANVNAINFGGDKVLISGVNSVTAETFSAEVDKVIVTVPISILKSGAISFAPSLPSNKTSALGRMDMDATLRVLLDFKANFWGSDSGFLFGGKDGPDYFNSGAGRSSENRTMAVTIAGPKAAGLSPLGKELIPVLLGELDSIFDGKATQNIRKDLDDNIIAVIQDWTLEPTIQGGVAYAKPGGTHQDRIDLASPIGKSVFFAGEATDLNGEFGNLNGALLSAERCAQEIIDSL
jgi:monoamine oxidase